MATDGDPFDLARFVAAQAGVIDPALAELRAGRKRTHWMWFVFPQITGLGHSAMAQRYAISDKAEARAYLAHPVLGPRLVAAAEAMLTNAGRSATSVLGTPDDLTLRSSATLFAAVSADGSVFHRVLDAFFDGVPDAATTARLEPR